MRLSMLALVLPVAACIGSNGPIPAVKEYNDLGRTAVDPETPGILHLTFDDGPDEETREVVDTLVKHGVVATFFQMGKNISGRRDVLDYMQSKGMQIGNHTYYHESQPTLSEAVFKQHVSAVKANIGGRDNGRLYFRFPYGAAEQKQMDWLEKDLVFDGKRYKATGWNMDSQDWDFGADYPDTEFSTAILEDSVSCGGVPNPFQHDLVGWVQFITRKTKGGLILFHDIQPITRDKLDIIITYLKDPTAYWKSLDIDPTRKQTYTTYYQCEKANATIAFKFQALHSGAWPSFKRD
jgi:peptidoglycan/xylan/chitin deacetylase (PgdA/CDA1 family)